MVHRSSFGLGEILLPHFVSSDCLYCLIVVSRKAIWVALIDWDIAKLTIYISFIVVARRVSTLSVLFEFQLQWGTNTNTKCMVININNSAAFGVPAAGVPTLLGAWVNQDGVMTSRVPLWRRLSSSALISYFEHRGLRWSLEAAVVFDFCCLSSRAFFKVWDFGVADGVFCFEDGRSDLEWELWGMSDSREEERIALSFPFLVPSRSSCLKLEVGAWLRILWDLLGCSGFGVLPQQLGVLLWLGGLGQEYEELQN